MNRGGVGGGWGVAATSHYVSAVHQGNWSVCDSYCQDGEGKEVMERRQKEGETGGEGAGWRKGGAFCLTSSCFNHPSLISDVIQVTYSSSRGSLPPRLSF